MIDLAPRALDCSAEQLQMLMASLADVTLASFALQHMQTPMPQSPAPSSSPSRSPPAAHRLVVPRLDRPKDFRILEALARLQKRREQARASGPPGPRIVNSHFRARSLESEAALGNARIHFPRKPHG